MKQMTKQLLAAALLLSATQAHAFTNKTFMMPRPQGVNLPLARTIMDEAIHHNQDNRFGGNLQVAGFYTSGVSKGDLGKYFGVNNKSSFTGVYPTNVNIDGGIGRTGDFDLGEVILDLGAVAAAANFDHNVSIKPSYTTYGVQFDYHQELDQVFKGLYFKAKLPIARVETNPGLNVTGPNAKVVTDYFAGNLEVAAAGAGPLSTTPASGSQQKLTNALMKGKQEATGVADLDLSLGYEFLNNDKWHASFNLSATVPTGNEASGKYAFEPIYGNGNHFAFGGGLELAMRCWGDYHTNLRVSAAVQYRFLFKATERRTLGWVNGGLDVGSPNGNFGQYFLLGQLGQPNNTQQFIPAANVTNQRIEISPGSQLEGVLDVTYNIGNVTLDLGYNLYARERESAKRKDAWNDAQYGFVPANQPLAAGANFTAGGNVQPATASLLDITSVETPLQITNKIYGSAGYIFKEFTYPVFVGAGLHYEIKAKNSAIENWGGNLKVGVAF